MTAEIPDILLERYRLKELPPDETARLEDRLRHDEPLRRRLEALDRSDEEIRQSGVLDRLGEHVPRSRPVRRRLMPFGPVPAAIAVATVVALMAALTTKVPMQRTDAVDRADRADRADRDDRIKGGLTPSLAIYRRTPEGSETLADGAVAHPGDLLRVGYRAAGKHYGVILSIDGRGSVTVHLPPQADRAAALKGDGMVLLDQAYELDDAPQWERFYFVTSDTPFAVAPIVEAVRAATADRRRPPSALALPDGLDQVTFSVQKEARP
jgi:hypothetical protein